MSHVVHEVLRNMLGAPFDMRHGVSIEVEGLGHVMLFGVFGTLVGDCPALFEVIGAKGASATKPCPFCPNIVSVRSGLDHPELVSVVSLAVNSMHRHTDASIKSLLLYLQRRSGELGVDEFQALCTMHGYNHIPHNLFRDNDFGAGVASCVLFDWMHVIMALFNIELWLLIVFSGGKRSFAQCGEFIMRLKVPRSQPRVHHLFAETQYNSCREAEHFKATASEGLTLCPLVRKWCSSVLIPSGSTGPAESFIALAAVIDLLCCSRNGVHVTPAQLDEAMLNWLHKHTHAYGDDFKKPKTHYALHLGAMLTHRKFLCACWVHERHHKVIKRFAQAHRNLRSMEDGMCEELIAQKVHELTKPVVTTGLLKPRPATTRIASEIRKLFGVPVQEEVLVSARARVDRRPLCMHDVALANMHGAITAGRIIRFYTSNSMGDRVVFVPWTKLDSDGITARYRVETHTTLALPLDQILDAVIHSTDGNIRHILLPPQWQSRCA